MNVSSKVKYCKEQVFVKLSNQLRFATYCLSSKTLLRKVHFFFDLLNLSIESSETWHFRLRSLGEEGLANVLHLFVLLCDLIQSSFNRLALLISENLGHRATPSSVGLLNIIIKSGTGSLWQPSIQLNWLQLRGSLRVHSDLLLWKIEA